MLLRVWASWIFGSTLLLVSLLSLGLRGGLWTIDKALQSIVDAYRSLSDVVFGALTKLVPFSVFGFTNIEQDALAANIVLVTSLTAAFATTRRQSAWRPLLGATIIGTVMIAIFGFFDLTGWYSNAVNPVAGLLVMLVLGTAGVLFLERKTGKLFAGILALWKNTLGAILIAAALILLPWSEVTPSF